MNDEIPAPDEALAIIKASLGTAEERAARAARIQAIYNGQPPYKREDLEKIPWIRTSAEGAPQEIINPLTVPAERPHHPYGPSTLSSLRACPSFEGNQSETPHFRTVIGQKGHAVIETGVDDATLSDEDAALAVQCMEFYAEQKQLMGEGATEISEVYLPIDDEETTAGYLDRAIISADETRATLLDWKLGRWEVPPAKDNPQIKSYVLGLFRAKPKLQLIKAIIFQPTLEGEPSSHLFLRSDVPAMHAEIWAIVARAKAARAARDFSTAMAYYPNCNFCKHIGRCPAVEKLAGPVGAKFAPLIVPADVTPSAIHDPAQVKQAWQLAAVVEAWAKGFRQVITDRVLCHQCSPPEGYRLEARSKREIVDAARYKEIALRRLTAEEYDGTLSPSLTAVEDIISMKAPRGLKTAAVEEFAKELEEMGAVVKGQPYAFLKAIPQRTTKTKQSID